MYNYDEHFATDGRSTLRRSGRLQSGSPPTLTSVVEMNGLSPVAEGFEVSPPMTPFTSTRLVEGEMDEKEQADAGDDLAPLTDEIRSIAAGGVRLSRKDSCHSSKSLIHKKLVSREAFFAQAILIYIISVACVVNLSLGTGPSHVWVALLSGCLGYILPEPKIRREKVRSVIDLTKDTDSLGR